MCEKCDSVTDRLESYLAQLENEFPGTEVDGAPAPRGHHVMVALLILARERFAAYQDARAQDLGNTESNPFAAYGASDVMH